MKDQCDVSRCILPLLGRFLLSIIFIVAGIGKIVDFTGATAALKQFDIGGSAFLITIALLIEIIGGMMILVGWKTRWACYLLMIFLFPTTLLFHSFWNFHGATASLQLSLFLKNLAIYGGLLLLVDSGPGRCSIDALLDETES